MRYGKWIWILTAILLSCGKNPSSSGGEVSPQVRLKWAVRVMTSQIVSVTVRVEGAGMAPITEPLTLERRDLYGRLSCPAGPSRTFTVEAKDASGVVLYQGVTTANLPAASSVVVEVKLEPAVFIVAVTPSDTTTQVGGTFRVEVGVWNVEELFGASVEIGYDGTVVEAVDAGYGDLLGGDVVFLKQIESDSITFSGTRKRGAGGISGSGGLGWVQFRGKGAGISCLSLGALALRRADGTDVPDTPRVVDGNVAVELVP